MTVVAAFAGPIRERPAAVRRETSLPESSGGGAPPGPARVAVWWSEMSPTAGTHLA